MWLINVGMRMPYETIDDIKNTIEKKKDLTKKNWRYYDELGEN